MSTLEQLEAEARRLYPYPTATDDLCRRTHVRARTVTAEQVDDAARSYCDAPLFNDEEDMPPAWERMEKWEHDLERDAMRLAFRAAGFYIEEEA